MAMASVIEVSVSEKIATSTTAMAKAGMVWTNSAGMFSSYDWVSSFSRGYKNIGDKPVECRLRVRGELERRSSGRPYLTGEAADFTFALEPGEVNHVEGEVGIEGFNDSRYQVTTSDRLECWYR